MLTPPALPDLWRAEVHEPCRPGRDSIGEITNDYITIHPAWNMLVEYCFFKVSLLALLFSGYLL